MKIEEFLYLLLFLALGLFLVRWLINWNLLNLKNGTSFSMFRANYSLTNFFGLFRHMAISEWKVWWFDIQDQKTMKVVSNILSAIIYLLVIGLVITIIIEYKTYEQNL